jgi:hypothetical protein
MPVLIASITMLSNIYLKNTFYAHLYQGKIREPAQSQPLAEHTLKKVATALEIHPLLG